MCSGPQCLLYVSQLTHVMIHWDCKGWGEGLQLMTLSCLQLAHSGFLPPENLPNEADWDNYRLLCPDNLHRMPVDKYKDCHLASVPSHAVVARSVGGKEDLIWELLNQAQVFPPSILTSYFVCMGWVPA